MIRSGTRRLIVETSIFRSYVDGRGGDELLRRIQQLILENPEEGATIAGTGGIRKMRIEDPQRGKGNLGGFRVLYLDLPDQSRTYLITLYDKGRKEDVSRDEKAVLRELVAHLKFMGDQR